MAGNSSSILTNQSALTALSTLRDVNGKLRIVQDRISTGLKVSTGRDNASYFNISSTMKADVASFKSVGENLTLTKNAITVGRTSAQAISKLVETAIERVAFSLGQGIDLGKVQNELTDLASQAVTALQQGTFNGNEVIRDQATITVTTGLNRRSGLTVCVTSFSFTKIGLSSVITYMGSIDIATATASIGARQQLMTSLQEWLARANDGATSLGLVEKRIEQQQEFIQRLTDEMTVGIGALIDADMTEESSRLQALQVQQQLATQALSIANQQPQSILALFQ
jgi:flagellin